MSTRVNYDTIAHLYDDRRRDHVADERLATYLAEHDVSVAAVRVLDIGCGTGKQLAADHARYPEMRLTGVDFSAGMLRIAKTRDASVRWLQGDAQALPLLSGTFDYATNQFSYPHIGDKAAFAAEVFRVLRPGGRFVLTNIDPWAMRGWALYRYFPDAFALDARDFLPVAELRALLTRAAFTAVAVTSVERQQPEDPATLLASARQRHSASQLLAISDAAYEAGLQRIRDDVARGLDRVDSPFVVVTVQGDAPV